MSFGLRYWKFDITTPSTTYNGLAEALMVEIPRMITRTSPPGCPVLEKMFTPAALPFNPSRALND